MNKNKSVFVEKQFTLRDVYTSYDFSSLDWCQIHVERICYDFGCMPSHRHKYNQAFVILSGQAVHVIGDNKQTLKRGDFFVIKGDSSHEFHEIQNLELINLMYLPMAVSGVWSLLRMIPGFGPLFVIEPKLRQTIKYAHMMSLNEDALSYITHVVENLDWQINTRDDKYLPVIRMGFQTLLAYLAVQIENTGTSDQPLNVLARSIRFMNENLANPINLTDIANNIYISIRHLQRLFNTYYDVSPIQYLTKLRMDNALRLLMKEKSLISNAALLCGYTDPTYFSRVFKDTYGITPNDARRLLIYTSES